MGVFSYVLIVMSAVVWPTHQLSVPDSCGVTMNPNTRPVCANGGATRASCLSAGCCYVDPVPTCGGTKTPGKCYQPANCAVDSSSRKACGWSGISRSVCECKGCCFDHGSGACFEAGPSTPAPANTCTWQVFKDTTIHQNATDRKEMKNQAVDDCKELCKTDTTFTCKSFFYQVATNRCYLLAISYDEAKDRGLIRENKVGFDLYGCPKKALPKKVVNKCDKGDWKKFENCFISLPTGSVNKKEKNHVETLDDCKKMCETDDTFKCKAYYYKEKRCTITDLSLEEAKGLDKIRQNAPGYVLFGCPAPPKPVVNKCNWTTHDNQRFHVENPKQNLKEVKDQDTVDDCKRQCATDDTLKCTAYFYNKVTKRCSYTNVTIATARAEDLIRDDVNYTMNVCPAEVSQNVDPDCANKAVDMMFIFDESSSILPPDFEKLREFLKKLTSKIHLSPYQGNVGIILFGTSPRVVYTLKQPQTASSVIGTIKKIKQKGGNTNTHLAIKQMMTSISHLNGEGRSTAQKVAIVLTDGKSDMPAETIKEAKLARAQNIKILAVGVGTQFDKKEIEDIAGDASRAFVADFDSLDRLTSVLPNTACQGAPVAPPPTDPNSKSAKVCQIKTDYKMCDDIPEVNRTHPKHLYMIDPDGTANMRVCPFRVKCDFSGVPKTIIENDQMTKTCTGKCDESDEGCHNAEIKYHASFFQAREMMTNANSCSQTLTYYCKNAAMGYRPQDKKPFTYWSDVSGDKKNYWPGGDKTKGGCACGVAGNCAPNSKNQKCNCDARDSTERSDTGTITDMKILPVKAVAIGDIKESTSQGCYAAGALICTKK